MKGPGLSSPGATPRRGKGPARRRAPDTGRRAAGPPPRSLIEDWLPAPALGFEAQRERAASSALPPLYFLHVWWARRPLVVSRAAVLASLLPAWRRDWPRPLRRVFPSRRAYHAWFLEVTGLGLGGEGGERGGRASDQGSGVVTPQAPQPGAAAPAPARDGRLRRPRAFTHRPSPRDLELLQALFEQAWGTARPRVLDPMAGGGSIPLEALRCGLEPLVNELNPVAWAVLQATLEYPARFGPGLAEEILAWGRAWAERARRRLERFYPARPGGATFAYLWARTVPCPDTGRPVPLSPNWWLRRAGAPEGRRPRGAAPVPVAARVLCESGWPRCRFDIASGEAACARARPDKGTVRYASGLSPWTGRPIPQAWTKSQAQAGRLGQQLYAVAVKTATGLEFEPPAPEDEGAADEAEAELGRRLAAWRARGLVPDEPYPADANDSRPRLYGMPAWWQMFSPRQLLAQCTMLEALGEVAEEMGSQARARAVLTYLALALDKACDYNSRFTRWDPTRAKIANTFARHDFSLKWSHAEFDAARSLLPWALDQVAEAYRGLARMLEGAGVLSPGSITLGDAASLPHLPDGSVHLVCLDPPYFDNVQYAECSDFFYVWLKRALGGVYPEAFQAELTDKAGEAVANPARFRDGAPGGREREARQTEGGEKEGRGPSLQERRALAADNFRRRMAACLGEAGRVLRPGGLLTMMFTHKQVEAWAALGAALVEAGFEVRAAWPVLTESQHSTHQARKAAATSTVLLVCRKRKEADGIGATEGSGAGRPAEARNPATPHEVLVRVRRAARRAAHLARSMGLRGPDAYIAAFGPALALLTGEGIAAAGTGPPNGRGPSQSPQMHELTAGLAAAREAALSVARARRE